MVQLFINIYYFYTHFLHPILILGIKFLDSNKTYVSVSLVPRHHADFISRPWRKIGGLGTRLCFGNYALTIIKKIKVLLARVIKKFKFTILSHPSDTKLFTIAVRVSQPRSKTPPSFPSSIACSCTRSAVGQGLKSSQITREYTYFRKNRVQIRKSRHAGLQASLVPSSS